MMFRVGSVAALSLSLWLGGQAFANGSAQEVAPILVATGTDVNADVELASTESSSDSYPRVTAIENALLGKSFVKDDLAARLSRLEVSAFGKASSNPDLGDRTDALQQYAEKKLNRKLFKEDPDFESASGDGSTPQQAFPPVANQGQNEGQVDYNSDQTQSSDQAADQGDYPHITELEMVILGKNFAGESIEERLNRMETKAFGAASKNPDLSARTDALDSYCETKLHVKPVQQDAQEQPNSSSSAGGPNRSRQLLTAVGTSLINIAGMGIPGALGLGPALGPAAMGFGGVRVRHRQDVPQGQQQDEQRQPESQEDPLVFETNPPPPSAKLLTQVGWCEMQVFGHTFPTMHLTKRLGQLNLETKFAPGKSGIDLMDDSVSMIKAAQNHKRQSISNSQPAGQN